MFKNEEIKMKNVKSAVRGLKRTYPTAGLDLAHYVVFQAVIVLLLLGVAALWPYDDVMASSAKVNAYLQENGALPGLDTVFGSQIDHDVSQVKGFFVELGSIIILAVALIFFFSGLFRSLVYSRFRDKGYSLVYFKRFILNNTLWLLSWLIIILLCAKFLVPAARNIIIILAVLLYIHLSVIFRHLMDEKKGYLALLDSTFATGFKKIYIFIVPALVICISYIAWIILFIMLIPSAIIKIFPAGTKNALSLVLAIVAVLMLFMLTAFVRQYYIISIESIKKRG